jgi:hypothetical protein
MAARQINNTLMSAIYITLLVLGILVIIRLFLPVIAKVIANRALRKMDGMRGLIRGISINFFRGAITVHKLTLAKLDQESGIETLSVSVKQLSIQIPLHKLIRKNFFGSLTITEPDILYASVLEKIKPKKNKKDESKAAIQISPLKTALQKMPPFALDVVIHQGKVRYINHTAQPKIDTTVSDINIKLQHLSNQEADTSQNSSVKASAVVYEGAFLLEMQVKPMEDQLTFDMNMELKNANMVLLNNFFREYANMDVNQGTFGLLTEIVAKDGAFKGYLKPILKDIDIVGAEDSDDSIFKKIWERVVASVFQLLENSKTDQITTRIPFEGRLDDPHLNVFAAIGGILKNAFVRAIRPSFENTFNLGSVFRTALSGTEGFVKRFFK